MCGFIGFTGIIDQREDVIRRMAERIVHRGPDSGGFHTSGETELDAVTLGFRRLSIIDLADGSQPMYNEDGSVVITFNGEIYNFMELREQLLAAGHTFKTRCDTEVLVHGYEEWGEKLAEKLRGMFEEALDFRAEQERAFVCLIIIEGFDAEGVAGTVEGAGLGIADHEREHSAQLFRELFAPLFVAVNENFGVTAGLEGVSRSEELFAQFHEVVDFAVERDDDGTVLVVHGLGAVGKVDDGKTAETEGDGIRVRFAAHMKAAGVGTAMDNAFRHAADDVLAAVNDSGKSDKTAHIF